MSEMKKIQLSPEKWIGFGITALCAVIAGVFLVQLGVLGMLPWFYFALVCLVMALLVVCVAFLWKDIYKKTKVVIGVILAIVILAVSISGIVFLSRTMKTLRAMTTESDITVTEMSLYVRNEDPAQTLNDCTAYTIGIMEVQDRDVTNEAIQELQESLKCNLTTMEFEGPIHLVEALLTENVDAILFSPLFFELVQANSELDVGQLRQVSSFAVITTKVVAIEDQIGEPPIHSYDKEDVFTVYISGLDQNGAITNSVGNGDVNIIATVNVKTHEVALVSTPRDSYLELSNWNIMDKLTHAAFYGVDCSMDTLENLYGIDIDYYFRVNYTGFCQIIDAMGGIELVNDEEFTSDALAEEYYFPEGPIHLNGLDALSYVRCRHAFRLGDVTRGKHQVMVLKAVLERAMSWDVVSRYGEVMNVMGQCFETDIPMDIITDLVHDQLYFGEDWHIVYYTSYGWTEAKPCYSYGDQELSVMILMSETVNNAKELMRQVREGEVALEPVDPSY